jgi:DNA anti-recombination protein RmuC
MLKEFFFPICKTSVLFDKPKLAMHLTSEYSTHHSAFAKIGNPTHYRVIVAGPTTLWSILNSLQMGFRTLAIEKRTSEVWNLLAGVKTEWSKYSEVLDAVEKKLHQATDTIEKAKVRSRAIGRKLKDVQELPATDATLLLPDSLMAEEAEPTESDVLEEEEVGK